VVLNSLQQSRVYLLMAGMNEGLHTSVIEMGNCANLMNERFLLAVMPKLPWLALLPCLGFDQLLSARKSGLLWVAHVL
jgi:hypothetical protein